MESKFKKYKTIDSHSKTIKNIQNNSNNIKQQLKVIANKNN